MLRGQLANLSWIDPRFTTVPGVGIKILVSFVVTALLLVASANVDADLDQDFPWVTGFDTTRPPARGPRPGLNQKFVDAVHGTSIQRITDTSSGWRRHEYSRRPAFNHDSSRIIMRSSGGYWDLYSVDGDRIVYQRLLPSPMDEPNWHPTDPDVYRYFPYNGDGMVLREYNVRTQASRVLVDFNGRLPWSNAARVWTRWEGRPSADGRIWCLMAEDQNFQTVGLFSYDLVNDRILGTLNMSDDPDHISTSVSGRYCIPSSTGSMGTRAYSVDFSRYQQLSSNSEHSDTALDANGRDVLVIADYSGSTDGGWIRMADLATGQSTRLVPLYQPQGSAYSVHISGLATETPGYAVLSTYAARLNYGNQSAGYGDMWGHDRLAIVELKSNPEVYNVAYMRNGPGGYFSEPQATVNHDLTKIIFASTWGSSSDNDVRSYMVTLPAGDAEPEPPTPTVSISASSVREGGGPVVVKVQLSNATNATSSVSIATAADSARNGQDFWGLYRVLTFAPGETEIAVPVYILDDQNKETDESFPIRLFKPSANLKAGAMRTRVTIIDND